VSGLARPEAAPAGDAGSAPADTPSPPIPAVETRVVLDMLRRGAPLLPLVVAVAGAIWGLRGAASAAFAVGVVAANFLLAATLTARAARVSLTLLAVAAFGGFFLRLALLFVVVLAVRNQPWANLVALGTTLAVTHAALLTWEARHVSFSLAFPGVKPRTRGRRRR